MNEHRRQVEQLFYAALELPPDGRTAFLRDVCGDDQRLFDEVRELLAHDAAANTAMPTVPRPGERWIDRLPPDAGAARPPGDVGSACPPGDFASGRSSLGAGLASSGEPSASHPTQVGAYRILGVIGEGGMGIVYRAEQENPRRTVALKVIRPEFASPQTLRRFEIEASVLARLQHPGVAQVYEAGAAPVSAGGRRAYFAMELVDGRTLLDYANGAGLRTRARLELLAKVCDAVEHAHQKGVIHRDLKPANIIMQADGTLKLIDFGLARSLNELYIRGTRVRGTPAYMAPEQIQGIHLTTSTDLYQIGISMYEMLTGKLPFPTGDMAYAHVHLEPPSIREKYPDIDPELEQLVLSCLQKNTRNRPASADALLEALQAIYARLANQDSGLLPLHDPTDPGLAPRSHTLSQPSLGGASSSAHTDPSFDEDLEGGSDWVTYSVLAVGIIALVVAGVLFMDRDGEEMAPTVEPAAAAEAPPARAAEPTPPEIASDAADGPIVVGAASNIVFVGISAAVSSATTIAHARLERAASPPPRPTVRPKPAPRPRKAPTQIPRHAAEPPQKAAPKPTVSDEPVVPRLPVKAKKRDPGLLSVDDDNSKALLPVTD